MSGDPFYVGYLPLPRAWRGFVIGSVAVASAIVLAVITLLVAAQPRAGDGSWADDEVVLEGTLTLDPYPTVFAVDPAMPAHERAWLLVAEGKLGALERATAALGGVPARRVRVHGLPLRRQDQRVFELIDGAGAIEAIGAAAAPLAVEQGEIEVSGEIIDPKCWNGAMRPGSGLVHRACAALCIRGGIPPCFVGSVAGGSPRFFVLTDRDGQPCNEAVAERAGVLVRIRARRAVVGAVELLRIDPQSIEYVPTNEQQR